MRSKIAFALCLMFGLGISGSSSAQPSLNPDITLAEMMMYEGGLDEAQSVEAIKAFLAATSGYYQDFGSNHDPYWWTGRLGYGHHQFVRHWYVEGIEPNPVFEVPAGGHPIWHCGGGRLLEDVGNCMVVGWVKDNGDHWQVRVDQYTVMDAFYYPTGYTFFDPHADVMPDCGTNEPAEIGNLGTADDELYCMAPPGAVDFYMIFRNLDGESQLALRETVSPWAEYSFFRDRVSPESFMDLTLPYDAFDAPSPRKDAMDYFCPFIFLPELIGPYPGYISDPYGSMDLLGYSYYCEGAQEPDNEFGLTESNFNWLIYRIAMQAGISFEDSIDVLWSIFFYQFIIDYEELSFYDNMGHFSYRGTHPDVGPSEGDGEIGRELVGGDRTIRRFTYMDANLYAFE